MSEWGFPLLTSVASVHILKIAFAGRKCKANGQPQSTSLQLSQGGAALTKADIVRQIAQGTGLTKTDVAAIVDGFIESVIESLERGDHIEIRGFGTFKSVTRAPRTGRNPRTGSEVKIASRRAPVFKPSKELRARVEDTTNKGDKKNAVWPEEKAA